MSTAPITPTEARTSREEAIPDVVFEIFNKHIIKELKGRKAVVYQDTVAAEIVERLLPSCKEYNCKDAMELRVHMFDYGWLDIEPRYREAGWDVKYERPGYGDDFDAHFTFTEANTVMSALRETLQG